MKTTIIIPNYNGIEYLQACIESLRVCRASYGLETDLYEETALEYAVMTSESDSIDQPFSILVVDNGSTDGSVEWLRKQPDINHIALPTNTGFAAAVNRGIEAATTPYVFLLNNDTTVRAGAVEALEGRMDSDESIFSVSARMVVMQNPDIMDGAGDYYCALGWAYAYGKGGDTERYSKVRRIFSACAGAAIYRRDILRSIGMFDENHFAYLEDVDVGYRGRLYGYVNLYEPKAIVLHAGSGFSGSRYNEFKVSLSSRNSIYIIWKNMPVWQIVLNLPLFIIGFGIKICFFVLKGLGGTYIHGLSEGFKMCRQHPERRVRFSRSGFRRIWSIQLELWANTVRRFLHT